MLHIRLQIIARQQKSLKICPVGEKRTRKINRNVFETKDNDTL
jgi:hypothetical protein